MSCCRWIAVRVGTYLGYATFHQSYTEYYIEQKITRLVEDMFTLPNDYCIIIYSMILDDTRFIDEQEITRFYLNHSAGRNACISEVIEAIRHNLTM